MTAELFQAEGRTYMMKLTAAFRNFAKGAYNWTSSCSHSKWEQHKQWQVRGSHFIVDMVERMAFIYKCDKNAN